MKIVAVQSLEMSKLKNHISSLSTYYIAWFFLASSFNWADLRQAAADFDRVNGGSRQLATDLIFTTGGFDPMAHLGIAETLPNSSFIFHTKCKPV